MSSMEDPFFVVREEVQKAISSTQALFTRWRELLNDVNTVGNEEYTWTTNEIRNSTRSIEWDLEDLEETISIVEQNPAKFNLSVSDVGIRRQFIRDARSKLKTVKDNLSSVEVKSKVEKGTRQALINKQGSGKYDKMDNAFEASNQRFINEQHQQQQLQMKQQDSQLEQVGHSVVIMKDMGSRIGDELDDQALLLEDLGNEIETTDSRLQTVLVRVEKVLRLADDKKQTYVLLALLAMMVLVIILFFAI